jgi:hypothetical protein
MSLFLPRFNYFIHSLIASCALIASPQCSASDSFTSEMSHVISGAAIAGYITHRYSESEYRSWIGFGVSTAIVIAEQNYEISKVGNRSSQQLDMVAHAIGSAIGAWYTNKYLLTPIVKRNYLGITIQIPLN